MPSFVEPIINYMFGMPAATGALTQVRAAVDPAVKPRDFLGPGE